MTGNQSVCRNHRLVAAANRATMNCSSSTRPKDAPAKADTPLGVNGCQANGVALAGSSIIQGASHRPVLAPFKLRLAQGSWPATSRRQDLQIRPGGRLVGEPEFRPLAPAAQAAFVPGSVTELLLRALDNAAS